MYAQFNPDFPPQSNRPRGALYITDRSMDLNSPLIHEFTYQAMVHDLLHIQEGDKVTYKTLINEGEPNAEEKEMEISDKDKIWVEYRHRHMKDTITKLIEDFKKFMADNSNFTNADSANVSGMNGLNAIKDMMAGLPQYQQMKEAYSLNISMAQESMTVFQKHKLPDVASVEQVCYLYLPNYYLYADCHVVLGYWAGRGLPKSEKHGRSGRAYSRRGRRYARRPVATHRLICTVQRRHSSRGPK